MTSFKTLNTKKYSKATQSVTPDTVYWKKLNAPVLAKEFGAIDYVDFSPVQPHYFAVSCSVRVQIYNPITKLVVKNLSRFEGNAYGATFRKDGRLVVAGDENGTVKLFDSSSRSILRLFKDHKAAVHRAAFMSDSTHVVSFSDDRTAKLWDIPSEKIVQTFTGHEDYIRAGCTSPVSPNVFVSGSYDKIVRAFDTRIGGLNESNIIFEKNHGSPIESLLFLPAGGIILSAGGTEIKVWDAFSSGKLRAQISQHHKTVTCLRLASHGRRFMSAGLDRHVKVYDIVSYQPVHSFDFPNAVLSLGVAPNDETLVAGMVDGLISIQRMEESTGVDDDQLTKQRKKIVTDVSTVVDVVVPEYERNAEAHYDRHLRKYDYTAALDAVLLKYVANKSPHITVAVMQELIRRKGLARALAGRTQASIAPIVSFIYRNIVDFRFTRVLCDVANCLLDVYESKLDTFDLALRKEFLILSKKLHKEAELTKQFLELQGALELVMAGASTNEQIGDELIIKASEKNQTETNSNELAPTKGAKEKMIISVS